MWLKCYTRILVLFCFCDYHCLSSFIFFTANVPSDIIGDSDKQSLRGAPGVSNVFTRFKKYLRSIYRSAKMQDDKLSIAPCSEFINLALVEKVSDRVSRTAIDVDAILTPDSQFVLVEGVAGMGKSTLCWELCRKWDTLESLKSYKIVLLLKLRESRVQNATTLDEIFYHWNKKLSQSVAEEVDECEGEGVLLILDGFDEMPASIVQNKSSLIMGLLSGTCLPSASRLVTTRPSALHQKEEYIPGNYRHVEILGFTDQCKFDFALHAFESEPEIFYRFILFIFSNPVITSFAYVPVNCAIIAQVYKDIMKSGELVPQTMTQLYSTLVLVLIRRYMIEKGEWDKYSKVPTSLKDLPKEVATSLGRVSQLAHCGLFKGDIQLVFADSDVGDGFQPLGLLSETKEMYVCEGARTSYSFFHRSVQEFLAAWHVSQHPELSKKAIQIVSASDSQYMTFAPFLSGIKGCCVLPNSHMTGSLMTCCYEAQDCSGLQQLSSQFIMCLYNPLETYAFGYVLVHASIEWHLNFINTDFNFLPLSLRNHTDSTDSLIRGSIVDIRIDTLVPPHFSPNLGLLPQCLLGHITKFSFRYQNNASLAVLSEGLPTLTNLQALSLTNRNYQVCEDDYLLYQSIQRIPNLKRLEVEFFYISKEGIMELSNALATCPALDLVRLMYARFDHYTNIINDYERYGWHEIYSYELKIHRIVEAALTCRTLKSLATNIPFRLPGEVTACLEHILFRNTFVHYMYLYSPIACHQPVSLFDCFECIADICKLPSMRTLWIMYEGHREYIRIPRQSYCNFLTILNSSLHLNPSMYGVRVDSCLLTCFQRDSLFSALSRNARQRRYSLPDVNATTVYGTGSDQGLCHTLSCPALQVLYSVHPLLDKVFRCHKLYHTASCLHTTYSGLQPSGLFIFS